jgi:hypothetical protein
LLLVKGRSLCTDKGSLCTDRESLSLPRLEVVVTGASQRWAGFGMTHTWYVTFEVPKSGTLVQRRNPYLTTTFETEAEAKDFARTKFHSGLIVTAGTVNPHLPKRAIPSTEIPVWLESNPIQESQDQKGTNGPAIDTD